MVALPAAGRPDVNSILERRWKAASIRIGCSSPLSHACPVVRQSCFGGLVGKGNSIDGDATWSGLAEAEASLVEQVQADEPHACEILARTYRRRLLAVTPRLLESHKNAKVCWGDYHGETSSNCRD